MSRASLHLPTSTTTSADCSSDDNDNNNSNKTTNNNENKTDKDMSNIPSHYRPYSLALKQPPFVVPVPVPVPPRSIQTSGSWSNKSFPAPQYSAFFPPLMWQTSCKSGVNSQSNPSSGCFQQPSTTPTPAHPHYTHGGMTMVEPSSSSSSSYQREHAHLKEMNNELLHKVHHLTEHVRKWETWYMTARHELDTCSATQARANHWKAQAEEMQRQKTVLMARVRRCQERHAAVDAKKRSKMTMTTVVRNKGIPKRISTTTNKGTKTSARQSASKRIEIPVLERNKSEETTDSHPRPFKKRCFGFSTNSMPSCNPPYTKAQKPPRSILKVRTSSTLSDWRCSTPNDDDDTASTSATPISPSPPQVPGRYVDVYDSPRADV